ncbi:hypothetical protein ACFVSQ_37350 [Streptomyces niveus]|uniref:hypothetical protein n=1 Tax=Streptomyces niveus TaxID=193462 RepID=UPI0036EF69E5
MYVGLVANAEVWQLFDKQLQALTRQWTDELRTQVPELSTDLDRLQAMRAEWLDSPPRTAPSLWPEPAPIPTATPLTDLPSGSGAPVATGRSVLCSPPDPGTHQRVIPGCWLRPFRWNGRNHGAR